MSLATVERPSNGVLAAPIPGPRKEAAGILMEMQDVYYLAEHVAASGMWPGVDKTSKAFALMMICQAEGIHPMRALQWYDIIEGKPAMKAQAIQAKFIERGGLIRIVKLDATEARAVFSHPVLQPEPIERAVTFKEYETTYARGKDGGIKKNWRESPSDMLWARLVSKTCRKIDPGITTGIPSAEDVLDSAAAAEWDNGRAQVAAAGHVGQLPPRAGDVPVPGGPVGGIDQRNLIDIVKAAADALGQKDDTILAHLRNAGIQQGLITGDPPTKRQKLVETLTRLYGVQRDWVRQTIAELAPEQPEPVEAALPPQPTATYTEADEPAKTTVPVPDDDEDAWGAGRE